MSVAETKRRGRPAKARDESLAEDEPAAARDEPGAVARPCGPSCPYCGDPTDRSTRLLRAYDMAVLRCVGCRNVAIEGDVWFDVDTAIAGKPPLIATRAAALYAVKHGRDPIPPADFHGIEAAVASEWDDPRWTTLG